MSTTVAGTGNNTRASRSVDLDYKPRESGDCIPDDFMAELTRRFVGTIPTSNDSEVVRSISPPADKTKLWLPVDALDKPIGGVRRYNSDTGKWVDDAGTEISDQSGINLIELRFTVPISGDTDFPLDLEGKMSDTSYSIHVVPLFDPNSPHADDPAGGKPPFYWYALKDVDTATISFRNVTLVGDPENRQVDIYVRKFDL